MNNQQPPKENTCTHIEHPSHLCPQQPKELHIISKDGVVEWVGEGFGFIPQQPAVEGWVEELENLKCVNGAMYFGSVENDSCNCKTRCQNEQTFEHAKEELVSFIASLITKAKEEAKEAEKMFQLGQCGILMAESDKQARAEERRVTIEKIMQWVKKEDFNEDDLIGFLSSLEDLRKT